MKRGKVTTVQDRSGKCLTEERQILNRWTEYCSELYNYEANGDPSVLNCPQTDTEDNHPILRREEEAAVQSLKKGKSAGVDNIPAELVQADGENVISTLTTIFNKIWQTGEWPTPLTHSLVITLPKNGNLQQCQNYRTISLNIFLERIMTDALEDHEGTVSIGGRTITNIRFADDIDGLAGEEEELANLVERLGKASTAYGMEINAEKTKLMTNNISRINTEIKVNGQKLETVTSF